MNRAILIYTTPYYALAGSSLLVRHKDFGPEDSWIHADDAAGILLRGLSRKVAEDQEIPLGVVVQMVDGSVHVWSVRLEATLDGLEEWRPSPQESKPGSPFYEAVLPWVRDRLTGDAYPRLQGNGRGV
jgi:hypothetical protein